jgi:hypothetical protein
MFRGVFAYRCNRGFLKDLAEFRAKLRVNSLSCAV